MLTKEATITVPLEHFMERHADDCECATFSLCELFTTEPPTVWVRCDYCGERFFDPSPRTTVR